MFKRIVVMPCAISHRIEVGLSRRLLWERSTDLILQDVISPDLARRSCPNEVPQEQLRHEMLSLGPALALSVLQVSHLFGLVASSLGFHDLDEKSGYAFTSLGCLICDRLWLRGRNWDAGFFSNVVNQLLGIRSPSASESHLEPAPVVFHLLTRLLVDLGVPDSKC